MGFFDSILNKGVEISLGRQGIDKEKFDKFVAEYSKKEAGGSRLGHGEMNADRGVPMPSTKLSADEKFLLYEKHDLTGGVINLVRDAVVSIPPEVRPRGFKSTLDKEPTDIAKKHMDKIEEFIKDPNASDEGILNIRKQAVVDLLVLGYAVLEKNPEVNEEDMEPKLTPRGTKKIGELWNLPSKYMLKVPKDVRGNLPDNKAYVQKTNEAELKYFDKDQVIWMDYNPLSHKLYSNSSVDQITESILDEIQLGQWNSSFVANNAMPEGVLGLEAGGKNVIQRATEFLSRYFGGVTRRGRILVTDKKVTWTPLNRSQADMQFVEYLKWIIQKYIIVFHLQPFVLGLLDSSMSKATAQQQVQAFKDYCLKPILDLEAFYYTQGIIKQGFWYS
ncbi:MAG: phage portal protein, partial [Nanoarchaeota archaeon]